MFTNRRDGLNCAFKAVEGVSSPGSNQFKSFVVLVATNFTGSHVLLLKHNDARNRNGDCRMKVHV